MDNLEVSTEMQSSTPALETTTSTDTSPKEQVGSLSSTVGESAVAATATPDALAVPAYQPNFKYSVRGQEKEIDEMFRTLIKDSESEKKIKELFEKSEGLDFVKQDRTALKSEFEGFKTQVSPYLQEYHKFTSLRDNGNLGAALQTAGISDEQIFKYALEKLEMEQNPQVANVYKSNQDAALKQFEMQTQLQQYEQMSQQLQLQQFEYDLSTALGTHQNLISQIEEKLGRSGAFREEVESVGVSEYHRGNNISVQQAVELVANKYKPFFTTTDSASGSGLPFSQAAQQQRQTPAVIPNTGSSNVSVIGRKPKSIDDIRKMRSEAV